VNLLSFLHRRELVSLGTQEEIPICDLAPMVVKDVGLLGSMI
jgi:hypothetical protein